MAIWRFVVEERGEARGVYSSIVEYDDSGWKKEMI